MSVSFNRVIIAGNLTRDVELRFIPSGTPVADVTIAVNDRRKQSDGNYVDDTQFVDVTVWSRTAEVMAEYCKKGSSVLIEGRLKLDTWEAEDGSKRSKLKVVGDRMQMLTPRNSGATSDTAEEEPVGVGASEQDGEIPF